MDINISTGRKPIIGVMGQGDNCPPKVRDTAFELGRQIAENGWITLSGGRNCGVMDAVCRGAKSKDGVTVGILPGDDSSGVSNYVDVPVITGMGSARNIINILTSDIVVACGIGPGTASEISLALKAGKPVVLVNADKTTVQFFKNLDLDQHLLKQANSPAEAIELLKNYLDRNIRPA